MSKQITNREKAILFALAAGYIKTWQEAYILARNGTEEEARNMRSLHSSVTHWKQAPVIVEAYKQITNAIQEHEDTIKAKAIIENGRKEGPKETEEKAAENKRTKETKQSAVDYYDPKNQRTQINKIIQEASDDPKTQLDAIKAIQQTQRDDRQAAREGKSVRVYLPLTCDTCPLAAKARRKA